MKKIYLPNKNNIYKTGDEDPVFFHYAPVVSIIYRKRLQNTIAMLGDDRHNNLLEIGYGSGLLLPELNKRCKRLYGVDIHNEMDLVYKMLEKEGVNAELSSGSILKLPYEDGAFDAVVSVSVLEHISELDSAIGEIKRVMRNKGILVLSFPVKNKITDLFYKLVGFSPSVIHPSGHREIEDAVGRQLKITDRRIFPSVKNPDYGLYMTLRCLKQ